MPAYAGMTIALFCTNLLAVDTSKNNSKPEPLSGLDIEDFQKTVANENDWDSNPFVKYGDTLQAKQMTLLGIIYSSGKSMALINSEIVKVGDKVGTSEVVAIEKQKVVLRNSDGLYEISMKGPQNEKT